MFRIRRIFDDAIPVNQDALRQVKSILKKRIPTVSEQEVIHLGDNLRNPFPLRFRPILFVAENMRHKVLGFAMLLHEPDINFCFLDWIATAKDTLRGGLGSALYERVRAECAALKVGGLFFECLPDTPGTCDPDQLKDNIARLRFYERYGARPIIGTGYETPLSPEDTCIPHLLYDDLGTDISLGRPYAKKVVKAILERKYKDLCPPEYVEQVVASFRDNPVKLRPFCHVRPHKTRRTVHDQFTEKIILVVNKDHEIHHIHERGYVESPVRITRILSHLEKSGLFEIQDTRNFPDSHIHGVHDADFIDYLARACEEVPADKSLYPYVFPIRNKTRPPRESTVLPGYYCIDTFTPIHRNAYPAARAGVNAVLTAADALLEGRRVAYALVRPPGHHAERRAFGGFCYFNNAAIAARYLREQGRVAILDIDYHHGNGQQDIFYHRSDILTVSIHGHPEFAYPYFTGFDDETGTGEGEGYNLNLPLDESVDGKIYRSALMRALAKVTAFDPDFLVVCLGLDTARNDPTGTWSLTPRDFFRNGQMIGAAGLPLLVVQEGGYNTRNLGVNARHFFEGLAQAVFTPTRGREMSWAAPKGMQFRYDPVADDVEKIRRLVAETGYFRDDEVEIAAQLVAERLEKGPASGYCFVMASKSGRLAGYGCYGPIPCTLAGYDIYWIAVSPKFQGKGLGQALLAKMEQLITEAKGHTIYVETASQAKYAPTRAFYERCGYTAAATLPDFYSPGDAKVIYSKSLGKSEFNSSGDV
ncbi:MAG: GNAT family N-acetyltransferase [Desulfotignum sp.]|nr:GNAT family N-acetyltransferase [Desulfotignum sp.]